MKAKVWFVQVGDGESYESTAAKVVRAAELAGLDEVVRPKGLIGILQHVGESDGIGFVKPAVTKALAERMAQREAKPFLTGSATLYRGRRSNAVDHIMQAYDHGFEPGAMGCPVVMCDGLRGADRVAVDVPAARHCKTAYLGSAVALMDGLVVVTHPTGHPAAGFGGAIKNVSMGLASRGGKLAMHHGGHPDFVAEKCTACGQCARWCPEDAIVVSKTAGLIEAKCVGCGQCFTVCPSDAIEFEWKESGLAFQEKLVEYCQAARSQLKDRILYLNVIRHFQKGCDCFGTRQEAVCPDVGIVAGRDIVAIDTATADLLKEATGRDVVAEAGELEYRGMLAYGEELGLGTTDYELIRV